MPRAFRKGNGIQGSQRRKRGPSKFSQEEADGQVAEVDRTVVVITVDNRGEYAVNDRLLVNSNKRTLVRALREVTAPLGVPLAELPVVIRADANATHQAVIRAMDAAGSIGLVQVSITTQQIDEDN